MRQGHLPHLLDTVRKASISRYSQYWHYPSSHITCVFTYLWVLAPFLFFILTNSNFPAPQYSKSSSSWYSCPLNHLHFKHRPRHNTVRLFRRNGNLPLTIYKARRPLSGLHLAQGKMVNRNTRQARLGNSWFTSKLGWYKQGFGNRCGKSFIPTKGGLKKPTKLRLNPLLFTHQFHWFQRFIFMFCNPIAYMLYITCFTESRSLVLRSAIAIGEIPRFTYGYHYDTIT